MEESASRRKAAARALLIARECDVHHVILLASEHTEPFFHESAVRIIRSKFGSLIGYRYKFDKEHSLAAAAPHEVEELIREHLTDVLLCDCHGHSVNDAALMELIHLRYRKVIYSLTSPGIRHLAVTLNADDRYEIAAPVQQIKDLFIHKSAVREDRKEHVLHLAGRFHNIVSEHGLTARKQHKAYAEFRCLAEYPEPLIFCKLSRRLTVYRGVVCARIASCTVQIAA